MKREIKSIWKKSALEKLYEKEVGKMDKLPRREYNDIFRRAAVDVNMHGCKSARAIKQRMIFAEEQLKKYALHARQKGEKKAEIYLWGIRKKIRVLRRQGFAERAIDEATENPNDDVGLTLRYGLKKALEINRRRAERRLGRLRPVKRERRKPRGRGRG